MRAASLCTLLIATCSAVSLGQLPTAINVPPFEFPDIGFNWYDLPSNTQLNVLDGGIVRPGLIAGNSDGTVRNVTVNVQGGTIDYMEASSGSISVLSSGLVKAVSFNQASVADIFGGVVQNLYVGPDSGVRLHGYDFRTTSGMVLGNVGTEREVVGVDAISQLIGSYSDGTPFAYAAYLLDLFDRPQVSNDFFSDVTVVFSDRPAISPKTYIATIDNVPTALRSGDTLVIDSKVEGLYIAGDGSSIDIVDGGSLWLFDTGFLPASRHFKFAQANVTMTGGELGGFVAYDGSRVKITGGKIGYFYALPGSKVEIWGGEFTSYAESFATTPESDVHFFVRELTYVDPPFDPISPPIGSTTHPDTEFIHGVFADGTPFAFYGPHGGIGKFDANSVRFTVVPEPSTVILAALLAVLLHATCNRKGLRP